jgi:hypothetical protein
VLAERCFTLSDTDNGSFVDNHKSHQWRILGQGYVHRRSGLVALSRQLIAALAAALSDCGELQKRCLNRSLSL